MLPKDGSAVLVLGDWREGARPKPGQEKGWMGFSTRPWDREDRERERELCWLSRDRHSCGQYGGGERTGRSEWRSRERVWVSPHKSVVIQKKRPSKMGPVDFVLDSSFASFFFPRKG